MKKIIILMAGVLLVSCTGKKEKEIAQYSIDQFFKNVSIAGGSFSPDETSLLVSSNETGIYNVFEISVANGTRRQVTNSTTESYFAVDYVPGTRQILYSADKGGNENNHIYLLNEDGTVNDLTPGDAVKASFNGWSKDKKIMYFQSNKRDPQFFDLYKMNVGKWKEELIYKNTEGYDYAGSTRDRGILALQKSITTSENRLFLYDGMTGKIVEVSEPDKPGSYGGSGFSEDKKYFFYTTDAGREFAYLVSYEIATGKRDVLYETDWDVAGAWLSENDKYRLVIINEDARYVLKIFNIATGEEVAYPEIPGTNIVNVNISESEKYLMLSLGSSKTTGDIYVCEIGGSDLKKLTSTMNPEIDPDNLVNAEVVRFQSFDGLEIPAIYYKPLTATRKNKVPALISVHGGPGGQSGVGYNPLSQYLVNHGYAVLAVNNRGSSGYGKSFFKMDDRNHGDKDLKDCIWGKKWLQSLEYVDSTKIGIIGGSYGGFMTMAAMTFHPDEFKVGVNFFGVTNWLRTLKSTPAWWASFRDALFKEMGDPFSADSVRLYNISPLFHAGNIKHPIMVLQGANDPRVLKVESDEIVAAVKAKGVPVEYIIFPDEGHGFVKKENEIKADSQILDFLDKYLKGSVAQQ
jgi:dipeptidyl aminopeptidase/acylaminoacyl peptidase